MQFSSWRRLALSISPLLVLGAFPAPAALGRPRPVANLARTIALSETGRLHPLNHGGTTITEEGRATGTYNCAITVHLVIQSAERMSATFTVRPSGGTVTGSGSARLEGEGASGYFGGFLSITKGTGAFARASGRGIGFSGTFNRSNFTATVHVHGTVHL